MFKTTHERRVNKAMKKVTKALGTFQKAHDDLEAANAELTKINDTAEQEILYHATHAKLAKADMERNKKLQDKLKEFM
jgi:Sec-independent protein translocase protein TatA